MWIVKENLVGLDRPRFNAIEAIKSSIPAPRLEGNRAFIQKLKEEIRAHKVVTNPAIAALNEGRFSLEQLSVIHLEYRHAIVQIFTDALLMAQFQSRQIEPLLTPGSKMAARFLLTLNILDEFGFRPGLDAEGYYRGNPRYAHYPLYEAMLDQLGITNEQRLSYEPSPIAQDTRQHLENSFSSFAAVVALLAVGEEEVILYSPPLRKATAALGFDVDQGYYNVHGTSEDEMASAFDDDHEDDLWWVLAQAMTSDDHTEIRTLCLTYCDLWDRFWTEQMACLASAKAEAVAA